ncbi:hypothetical protein ATCM_12575 [Stenotrophomonas sp. ATCM1_4]|uniref:hypothetical protein n=1 Tax=Stenotrophomonas sp. ATCM1_4 TaxID=2259330 RepID=UPI001047E686|nr:hypothetical protein [Stenotrophomonas sp. ATCM1_4]TDB28422.1 hypothetical protein ATCM_12575 [Stenotrophomonas sp. ATCM1_4]
MSDVRELLARLNPTTIRMDAGAGSGSGGDALTNIDVAGALGMVPAGLGRDLLELLYGPDPSRADIVRVFHGITRLALEERNLRSRCFIDAKTLWGIKDCIARFERDQSEQTRRDLGVLKARTAVAREQLFPERLEERMPQIAAVAIGYMKGERLSNRERAAAMGVSESAYRQGWSDVVDWLLTQMVEAEQDAARVFSRSLREEGAAG